MRVALLFVSLSLSACAVDPYLTCGEKCADGSTPDGSMIVAETGTEGGKDAPYDGPCVENAQDCIVTSPCCSGLCGSNQKCTSACQMMGQSCTPMPDSCCVGSFCSGSMCVQCLALNSSCTSSVQCCSGRCAGGEAGKTCQPD